MDLIKISDTVLINPDKISAVEIKSIGGKLKSLTIIVEGKSYISEVAPENLLHDLIRAGVNLHDQFFAG